MLQAVRQGHCDAARGRLVVREQDYRGWERSECQSLTLVFVVDVSSSTLPYRDILAKNLRRLREHFVRHNDRIALIALQGSQGQVLNHPTRNHRIVIRNLANMTIQGQTPLADGLLKALDVARLERLRKPGSASVVVLLSDCFPEPLSGKYRNFFDEPAYRRSLAAASLYGKRSVPLLVINPLPKSERSEQTPGKRLCHCIVERSGGKLLELSTAAPVFADKVYLRAEADDIDRIIRSIEDVFGSADRPAGRMGGAAGPAVG